MGVSHQTQGGKFGANPALSRNCDETASQFLSQDACRVVKTIHLRGTDVKYRCNLRFAANARSRLQPPTQKFFSLSIQKESLILFVL